MEKSTARFARKDCPQLMNVILTTLPLIPKAANQCCKTARFFASPVIYEKMINKYRIFC